MTTIDLIHRANLQLLAQEFGSVSAAAAKVGCSSSQYSQWMNGSTNSGTGKARGMRSSSARKIEQKAGKPVGWMDQRHDAIEAPVLFDENVRPAILGTRPIPVISAVQAGKLKDMDAPYEPGDGYAIEYTDDTRLSRWTFGLDVEGESMRPRFQDGDRLIVDPERPPKPGCYVIARNGSNQATFKKYRPRGVDSNGNEIFELVPLNEDYPTLKSDTEKLIIIGVVTEVRQKLI